MWIIWGFGPPLWPWTRAKVPSMLIKGGVHPWCAWNLRIIDACHLIGDWRIWGFPLAKIVPELSPTMNGENFVPNLAIVFNSFSSTGYSLRCFGYSLYYFFFSFKKELFKIRFGSILTLLILNRFSQHLSLASKWMNEWGEPTTS